MTRLVGIRLAGGLATLFAASILIFAVMQLLPGDAATAVLQQQASDKTVLAQLRHQYGLDRPLVVRYGSWIGGVVHGDFGISPGGGQAVSSLIRTPLRNTAVLLFITLLLMFPLAVAIGTASALSRDKWLDGGLQTAVLVFASLPSFVVGIVLILLFAFTWRVLPAVSLNLSPTSVILPIATLVLGWVPFTARMVRAGIVEVLDSDYVQMARLKGIPEREVVRRHVLPNSLVPAIQAFALTAASMPAGIVIVEYLFSFQGIGNTLVQSVENRDTLTVEAVTLILVVVYIVANLASDLATVMLTPRLRTRA
ncbi:MAG TPA: ABC transporter permease [Gaiellaceae bacterium]|jgi:peptide/nickel transport system permease protein